MDKRRLLIFTNSFRIGGSEGQALQLIKHLDRSRFDVYVACFDREGPLLDQLPRDVGEVAAFPLTGFATMTAVRQAIRFIRFLRKSRIQIVQTFDLYTNVFGLPLARVVGVPVTVGSRRDHGINRTKGQTFGEKWSLRAATHVVANAEAIRVRLAQEGVLSVDRIHVIQNGFDRSRYASGHPNGVHQSSVDSHGVVFGVVANLRPEKGHLVFLNAAKLVAAADPNARFMLIGDGPTRQTVEAAIDGLGLQNLVIMKGAVKNVPALLREVDVLVSPSDTEGLPNAVLEGMAASKAVVATDAGGTRELVAEGVTGYVVPVGRADLLADRMLRLAGSPSDRLAMGERGRQQVERCNTVEHIARQFESLYEKLAVAAGI